MSTKRQPKRTRTQPVLTAPTCATCTAACCRRYRVLVSAVEVRRISRAQGRPCEYGDVITEDCAWNRGVPVVEIEDGRAYFVLDREGAVCCLLDADGRCSVYAARPARCRRFEVGGAHCRRMFKARRGVGGKS